MIVEQAPMAHQPTHTIEALALTADLAAAVMRHTGNCDRYIYITRNNKNNMPYQLPIAPQARGPSLR
jgi:hypothetical protein